MLNMIFFYHVNLVQVCCSLSLLQCQIRPGYFHGHEEFDGKVDDLDHTEDGEAGEEPHGAADHLLGKVQCCSVQSRSRRAAQFCCSVQYIAAHCNAVQCSAAM